MTNDSTFQPYLARWVLTPDGDPIITPTSRMLPVRHRGEPAMLKVATVDEERWGAGLLAWWGGDGAVRVLAHDGDAILMERATGLRSLAAMAHRDATGDDAATCILCDVAARLHATASRPPPPKLTPLDRWFAALWPGAERHSERYPISGRPPRPLASSSPPRHDVVPLHGDLHHATSSTPARAAGSPSIPKRLGGEARLRLCQPLPQPGPVEPRGKPRRYPPRRLARQADIVAEAAGLDRERLLRWVLALCGLSTAWNLEDGVEPIADLAVAHHGPSRAAAVAG
jgi:streptomycin 6-kinase